MSGVHQTLLNGIPLVQGWPTKSLRGQNFKQSELGRPKNGANSAFLANLHHNSFGLVNVVELTLIDHASNNQ